MSFSEIMKLKELKNVDVNSSEYVYLQKEILSKRKIIGNIFKEFYDICISLDKKYFSDIQGDRIELGSGSSNFKKNYPHVLSTDIKSYQGLDQVLDAQDMALPDHSVGAFFGISCFHHFPDPDKFFQEISRCLKPGGGCVLIEPYYGFLSYLLFKKLHDGEFFDKKQMSWTTQSNGPMKGANQALSYIVFERDRSIFKGKYPNLEILYMQPINSWLRYITSGGITFKSIVPSFSEPFLKFIESLLSPFISTFAICHAIVIRKKC